MADQFVIEVNEGPVEISRQGIGWWSARRPLLVASGKLVETTVPCIVGGLVELGPYDRDDADFMAQHMVTVGGMPKTAVKVKRLKEASRRATTTTSRRSEPPTPPNDSATTAR